MRTSPALPVAYDAKANADIVAGFRFMQKSGAASAKRWLDLLESMIGEEARLCAGGRFHRATMRYRGEELRRVNFETPGGSTWAVYYDLPETDGIPDALYIVRVRHGRSLKGNTK